MSALEPADIRKLKASLSRLASPYDGEIIAAANAAGRILAKAGLCFNDLGLAIDVPAKSLPAPSRERRPSATSRYLRHRINLLVLLPGCNWTNFERKFLTDLVGVGRSSARALSPKQMSLLRDLENKATRHVAGGGA